MTVQSTAELAYQASQLRLATLRFARRLRSERAVETVSDAQFSVLGILSMHDGLTLRELAKVENVTAPSMNRTVNSLEAMGYLTRTTATADRRAVNIALTEAGSTIVHETARRRTAWLEQALLELEPDKRATLIAATAVLDDLAKR